METSVQERKEKIRKEMNKIMLQIEMNKFNKEKITQLKEVFNRLKKEYTQLLLKEKITSKKYK